MDPALQEPFPPFRQAAGIPFVHIEAANEKSLNLAMKTGFQPCGEIWWVKEEMRRD